MESVSELLRLGRPEESLRSILLILFMSKVLNGSIFICKELVFLMMYVLFASMAFTAYNDIKDYKIDLITNKNRPIPRKVISFEDANRFVFVMLLVSLVFMLLIKDVYAVMLLIFASSIGFAYSYRKTRLSYNFLTANLSLVLGYIVIPSVVVYIILSKYIYIDKTVFYNYVLILILISLLYFIVANFKDLKDIKGDKKYGKNTLFTLFDDVGVVLYILVFLSVLALILFNFGLYFINKYSVVYGMVSLYMVAVLINILKFEKQNNGNVYNLSSVGYLFGSLKLLILALIILY